MMFDGYQVARLLAEASARVEDVAPARAWMTRPWRLARWAGATDSRVLLLVVDFPRLVLPPIPEPHAFTATRYTSALAHDTLGTITLRELAAWANAGREALVGPAPFDRGDVAMLLDLMAMAGDCDVRLGVSRELVGDSGVHAMLMDAPDWRILLMGLFGARGCTDDTRPPLSPLPGRDNQPREQT